MILWDPSMRPVTKAVDSAHVLKILLAVHATYVKQAIGGFIHKGNVWNVLVVLMEQLHLGAMM